MTREEVIALARQIRFPYYYHTGEIAYLDKLVRFATAVSQYERDACAKICERWDPHSPLADAIRARSNT